MKQRTKDKTGGIALWIIGIIFSIILYFALTVGYDDQMPLDMMLVPAVFIMILFFFVMGLCLFTGNSLLGGPITYDDEEEVIKNE